MKSSVWIMEIWVVYSLELLCLKLFWIFSRGYGVDMCFHFFWVNILGHRVSAYITLQKIAELFLKWWYHFILLPIMCEFSCSAFLSILGIVGFFDYGHSNEYVLVSHGFYVTFPDWLMMISTFHGSLSIYIPSFVQCLFWSSTHLLDCLQVFVSDWYCFFLKWLMESTREVIWA